MNITYTNVQLTESGGCGKNPDLCYRYFSVEPETLSNIVLDFVYAQHRVSADQFYFNDLILLKTHGTSIIPVKSLQDILSAIREENEDRFFAPGSMKIQVTREEATAG
ncbi:hypothetical protein ACSBL2_06235 [Pedobacter sp. AW31-3R]|uniref:hypothetical protein n=1 Tax=Pedobacter sp. AW31-3R TaxID=3445781 RepID=UPI003F9EF9EE